MTMVSASMQRYDSTLRLSDALSACREPEQLASTLAEELSKLLAFDFLDVLLFKEDSSEIEWHAVGKGSSVLSGIPDEELMAWHVCNSQEPLHISDWQADNRFTRMKLLSAAKGIEIGSIVRLPLATTYRRLGTMGIASRPGVTYSQEDIGLLRLIARAVTSGIDHALSLSRSHAAQRDLQRKNERLELLLNLTNQINSKLDLREVLRTISANLREVMGGDFVAVSICNKTSERVRLFVIDYPGGRGFVREDLPMTQSDPARRAIETLKPVIANAAELCGIAPEACEELASLEGAKSVCLVPLVNHGRALGLLTTRRTMEKPFGLEEVEFLSQVAGSCAITIENVLAYEKISELKDKFAREKVHFHEEIRSETDFEQIVGNSAALKDVLQLVETVAPSDSTVLLLGETGTGKDLIARAIHERSRCKGRTLVKVNCAAIPTGLLESELFGHEKGAFTGAVSQKIGRMELADQGTLFLDEVGDIPTEIQPKLLRVLQEREFERLGSSHTRKVNIRLVAATNRDLPEMVRRGTFRNDLFYRLNVFPIHIPPLRERKEDIPLLVHYFVADLSRKMRKSIQTIPADAMDTMTAFSWPGNIRELQNFIERSVILSSGKTLAAPTSELKTALITRNITGMTFHGMEREMILHVLRAAQGKLSGRGGAAERLGLKRTTLQRKMERLRILRSDYAYNSPWSLP